MKNLLTATLPALGLLALGGCATSGALTSTTESDGAYYSSADKTTANRSLGTVYDNRTSAGSANPDGYTYGAPTTTATPANTDENANPDYYQGSTGGAAAVNNGIQGANGDYYVANSYNPSSFGTTYTGPGVSYVNYAPVTTVAYGSPYGYGYGINPYYGGFYSPYAYSAFYDPFYSPWGYGYGSGFSIGFGYGYGGGFGYPYGGYYGSPYGYGYGRGFGYPYGGGYYGDPYGYGGYGYGYGGGYYNRPVIYANGSRSGSGSNPVLVGPRGGRGGSVLGGRNMASTPANPVEIGRRNGGTFSTGGMAPAGGQPTADALGDRAGRRASNFGGGQTVATPAQPTGMASGMTNGTGQPAAQTDSRRGGFFNGFFGGNGGGRAEGANNTNGRMNDMSGGRGSDTNGGQPAMTRRGYSQPQFNNGGNGGFQPQTQRRGDFSQPAAQPQRSFDSQRSYSQPSQPSYNPAPSRSFGGGGGNFGGGGGGGNFGGGGGGGGRRR